MVLMFCSISVNLGVVPLYKDPIAIATFVAAGNVGQCFKTLSNGTSWIQIIVTGILDREFCERFFNCFHEYV